MAGDAELDELIVHDLDDLLDGVQAFQHVLADGPLSDRPTNLTTLSETSASSRAMRTSRRASYVLLGQRALAAQALENGL